MRSLRPARGWIGLSVWLAACQGGDSDPGKGPGGDNPGDSGDSAATAAVEVSLGPELACAAPVADGPGRFAEVGAARGLEIERGSFWGEATSFDGGLVARDLDGDGDADILLGRAQGAPDLFLNNGAGYFAYQGRPFPDTLDRFRFVATTGATDLDGDALPEILLVGLGGIMAAKNLGGGAFAPPEILYEHPAVASGGMAPLHISYGVGDLDGDGDLDLALPGLDWLPDLQTLPDPAYDQQGSPVVVLRNDGGVFTPVAELTPEGTAGFAMLAIIADREHDGDQDLLVSSIQLGFLDRVAPQAFYRNDGGAGGGGDAWVNEAEALSMALSISGMGGDVVDLNGDGRLDYCLTDTGPVKCMIDDGAGAYYDAGTAMGMVPAGYAPDWQWSGWSIEVVDLDNDGTLDAAISGGDELHPRQFWVPWGSNFPDQDTREEHHVDTLLWGDTASGSLAFTDRAAEIGFDTEPEHYGLAAVDLDGDGWREVLMVPPTGRPQLWQNRCGEGGWLEIALDGGGLNRDAVGAEVYVEAGGRIYGHLVQGLRGFGQSTPRVHVGLGPGDVTATIRVRWPDGLESVVEGVGARRVVTIRRG